MKFVGIDLAWSERNQSGVAVIDPRGRLVRASAEVKTNEEILEFARLDGPEDAIVTIDAPLIVKNAKGQRPVERELTRIFGPYDAAPYPANLSRPAFREGGRARRLVKMLEGHGFRQSPEVQKQRSQRIFLEVFPSPSLVILFPCHTHSAHTHCRPLRYKHKPNRPWAEVHSEWEIYRARLRSLECREPTLSFAPDVKSTIGIDITQYKGARYKPFDDLLDGVLCSYLAHYFWYWGREGSWVLGDMKTGYIVLPRCQVQKCLLMGNH